MRKRSPSKLGFLVPVIAAMALSLAAGGALAQVPRPDASKEKSSESLRSIFHDVVSAADKSTVVIDGDIEKSQPGQVALGTIVAEDGFILTKASEVVGHSKLTVTIGGKPLEAKLVGVSEPQDLAMLKVEATGLSVVPWADLKTDKVEVGEWVASASSGTKDEPFAVGVVSVGRRRIGKGDTLLGVGFGKPIGGVTPINEVVKDSAAEKAGFKVGDVIIAVNGVATPDPAGIQGAIREYQPGDVIELSVKRGEETLSLKATLGVYSSGEPSRYSTMNIMGGPVSRRSSSFAAVLQHDTVIRPVDCGGPLVDLTGKVIGINIARAGRTETYALPADIILPLIDPLKNGKLAPVNANAPGPIKPVLTTQGAATKPEHGE